jgi:hypothetical protein
MQAQGINPDELMGDEYDEEEGEGEEGSLDPSSFAAFVQNPQF